MRRVLLMVAICLALGFAAFAFQVQNQQGHRQSEHEPGRAQGGRAAQHRTGAPHQGALENGQARARERHSQSQLDRQPACLSSRGASR